jgi:hypothetical protein
MDGAPVRGHGLSSRARPQGATKHEEVDDIGGGGGDDVDGRGARRSGRYRAGDRSGRRERRGNQSFEVTGGGDNSNQCAGIQGVANTGNAQNVIDVVQLDEDDDLDDGRLDRNSDRDSDFEFEEVGSEITVSPASTTTCDQQVNQAASATG